MAKQARNFAKAKRNGRLEVDRKSPSIAMGVENYPTVDVLSWSVVTVGGMFGRNPRTVLRAELSCGHFRVFQKAPRVAYEKVSCWKCARVAGEQKKA